MESSSKSPTFKENLHIIIFGTETPLGKAFDIALIVTILMSVLVVLLDSVEHIEKMYGSWLDAAEWLFTAFFTIEYLLRLYSSKKPSSYVFSFYGLVDLFAILPSYLGLLLPGSEYLVVIRILRVLRVFRVLKLAQYIGEAEQLATALRASKRKIVVFLAFVLALVTVLGSLLYFIEGPAHGFTSIPKAMYWAIVTLTTVGYGDISPVTPLGQALASMVMILGYGILAVPTGIVTSELNFTRMQNQISSIDCPDCGEAEHLNGAKYCRSCGSNL